MFYLLAALFASAPLYVVRFTIGIPVNLLEILCLAFLLVFAFWLRATKRVKDFIEYVDGQPRLMLIFAGIFMLAGLISAIVTPWKSRGAGLFVVLFLEPILIYLPASYILSNPLNKIRMVKWIFVLAGAFSAYAIFQYFTKIGLPVAWQGNPDEPLRALSVFAHPNAFAMYLAPILAFLLPFTFDRRIAIGYKISYVLGIIGLLLSLSRGGWLGFGAAAVIYVFCFAKPKIQIAAAISGIAIALLVFVVPSLHSRAISAFKGDRSTQSRHLLQHIGINMIKDSPLLGKGLQGYEANFDKYNTDPQQPHINLAHNIFIDLWVETGLLGLISFVLICLFVLFRSIRNGGMIAVSLCLFLIAIFVHGQVDNPYFMNDLALVFWMMLAFQV